MQNFDRQYEFTFFDVSDDNIVTDVPNFKIRNSLNFSFNYTVITGVFNTAKFYFYNLSENTINLFAGKNNRRGFYFRASYFDSKNLLQSLIFRGLTFRVNSYRQGTEIITEVIACDSFFNLQQPTIKTINYKSGTTAIQILQDVSNHLGVFNSVSGTDFLSGKLSYNHPITFSNVSLIEIINMVANDNSCTWAFDIAGLKLAPLPNNPNYESALITNTPLLSRETGLVGNVIAENISAQMFPIDYYSQRRLRNNLPWVTATILLRPMPLFSKVRIQCEISSLNGIYFVFSSSYSGEFRGNPWYTTLKLSPLRSE